MTNLTFHRNQEEDRLRVVVLKSLLKHDIDVEYGLPKHVRVWFRGHIVDERVRKEIESRGWEIGFDEYRESTTVLIPHAKFMDGVVIFDAASVAAITAILWFAVKSLMFYITMYKSSY